MGEITKNDIIYFQNDILKDIKKLEKKLDAKIETLSKIISDQNTLYEQKFQISQNNILELSKKIATTNSNEDISKKFDKYQSKTDEKLYTQKIKISSLEKDLVDACYKYDSMISNNLNLPGIIGKNCTYPNVKSFFDYVNKSLKELILSKDKKLLDSKLYKDQITNLINQFKTLVDQTDKKFYKYTRETIENYDLKCNDKFKLLEESIEKLRVENGKYSFDLLKNTEKLDNDMKKIDNINIDIENRFKEEFQKYEKISDNLLKEFANNQNEFEIIKNKFTELSEFIKDVRFRANIKNFNNNYNYEDDRMKFIKMSKKIDFSKKTNKKNIIPNTNSIIKTLTEGNNKDNNQKFSQNEENCETKDQESFRKTIKVQKLTKNNCKGEESVLFFSDQEKENIIDNEDKDSISTKYPSIKPKKNNEKNLTCKIKNNIKELANCNTNIKGNINVENCEKKLMTSENINNSIRKTRNIYNNYNKNPSKTETNFYKPKNEILLNKNNNNTRNYTSNISKINDHRKISSSYSNNNLKYNLGKTKSNYLIRKHDLLALDPSNPIFFDKLNEPTYSSSQNIFIINKDYKNNLKLNSEKEQKVKKELLLNSYENNEDFEYMTEVKNKYECESISSREKELNQFMSIFPVKTVTKDKYNLNKSKFIHGKLNDKIKNLNNKLCMFISDSNTKFEQIIKQLNSLIDGTKNKKCNLVNFENVTLKEPNKLYENVAGKTLYNFRKDSSIQIGDKAKKVLKDKINSMQGNAKFMGSNDVLKQIEPFLIKKFK